MALVWTPIRKLPKGSEKFVLARNRDGFPMVFKASILESMLKPGTPKHLHFDATHFILCDDLLALHKDS